MTIKQLAEAINAKADAPVTASVVQAAPGQYRLVLTGKSTGAANAFTMTSSLTGGQGSVGALTNQPLTFTDTDSDGVYGDSDADNSQKAVDAALTVNNLSITSSTNTVENVVPGVTLTLLKKDQTKTISVGVTRANDASADVLNKFLNAYNDVQTFFKDQTAAAIAGKTSIGRDPVLRGFRDSLRSAMLAQYPPVGSPYRQLASIGVEFDSNGKLTLNRELFDKALADSPGDVQKLFGGTDGTGGVFGALKTLVTDYTQSGGLVAGAQTRLTDQVKNVSKRLDSLENQLTIRRNALQQQYIAADMAMSRMNSQGSSLSQLGGQYRLF